MDVRKPIPDGAESVRLISIKDFDTCPCCGTHVKTAGEIGLVKVLKYEKVKACTRIHFKAGIRALRDYQSKHGIISSLSSRFTTSPEKVIEKVEKLAAEHRDARRIIKKANEKLIVADQAQLLGGAVDYKGYRFVVRLLEAVDADYLRMLAAAFKSEDKIIVVLGSDTGCIVCNASVDVPIEVSKYLTDAAKRAGGTGGGKGSFANGAVPPSINMTGFLEEVFNDIKDCL
jgi:alanyl-tRNA synthetase